MSSMPQAGAPAHTPRLVERIMAEMAKVIVGQDDVIRMMLTTFFARGHLLFEGVPGLAKTLMVKALARATSGDFNRIQFTPDLLPSDIVGTNVFDMASSQFHFRPGPVFAKFVLADEVNRTPPKTQAALLEAMEERVVTVDGEPHKLPDGFTVFATQNPVEYEGTYPLPEAQLDRFLIKLNVDYPVESEERQILQRYNAGFDPHDLARAGLEPVMQAEHWPTIQAEIAGVKVQEDVLNYIAAIIRATRKSRSIALGASPRAGIALLMSAKALSAINGKAYITPDEVQTLAAPVLRHRLILTPESEIEGFSIENVITEVLGQIPVPR